MPGQSKGHLPGCESIPLEEIPDGVVELDERHTYRSGVRILRCVAGCPALETAQELGRQLAKEHGW